MGSKINEALEAYQLGILAKDLSGRYPNVNRTLMSIDRVGEAMMSADATNKAADSILAIVDKKLDDRETSTAPSTDHQPKALTHKDMTKRFETFERQLMSKIESLVKPIPVEGT